jgi:hypothetical protein
MISRDIIA